MKRSIYIASGLGADERVFRFLDFGNYDVHFIEWIPISPELTIQEYATQLIPQIKDEHSILIGLSFGGIISIEIAKQIPTKKVIIISSVKNKKEIPFYYRWIGKLNLHNIIPTKLLHTPNIVSDYFFGVIDSLEKEIFHQILLETDPVFLKWAIDKIIKWENTSYPSNLYHIHGTKDRILPVYSTNPDIKIEGGGHLMIMSHSEEIMKILNAELDNVD